MYSILACRMANLCMSWPVQAGIMSLRTPNSSFILDLLRRSIRLCAVLRAILRPAAVLVPAALACFLLLPAVVVREAARVGAEVAAEALEDTGGAGAIAGWLFLPVLLPEATLVSVGSCAL